MQKVKVAVLMRKNEPLSIRIYRDNIIKILSTKNVDFLDFNENGPIPYQCDLIWEPGLCMRRIPGILKSVSKPIVGTMHGVKAFSLPIEEITINILDRKRLLRLKQEVKSDWQWFATKVNAIISVSKFAANEVLNAFNLPKEIVYVIYHGVDQSIFKPYGESVELGTPYFLVVSRLDPIKNLKRIFEAYLKLIQEIQIDLKLIVILSEDDMYSKDEFPFFKRHIKGIHLIEKTLSQYDLAKWYRGALALVHPSLRETFGLPIIEAMSCGCPVITSNTSACKELANGHGLLVNPYSVEEITLAMKKIIRYSSLRKKLKYKGIKYAKKFTWEFSAKRHLEIFLKSVKPWR